MRFAILGYGKMGKRIATVAHSKGHDVMLKINSANVHELTTDALRQVDVAIEFSRPESAVENIKRCLENQVPVVSGTTGWMDQFDDIKAYCHQHNGALFYASNFSIGVFMFRKITQQLAAMMNQQPDYHVHLTETHHTEKLDAPSGTAITLAKDTLQYVERLDNWQLVDNHASTAQHTPSLPITAKRIDPAPGTHRIDWSSAIDTITIEHTAHSRDGFVKGAIAAAAFLVGKTGVFGMEDLMGTPKTIL